MRDSTKGYREITPTRESRVEIKCKMTWKLVQYRALPEPQSMENDEV